MSYEVFQGDCLAEMRKMPAASVDLVVCSPPYADARTYGVDFKLAGQEWVDWACERYRECLRVCRGLVAWVVEGRTKQYRYSAEPAMMMADLHRSGVHLRKPPIFHRVGIPGSGGPDWLRNDWEWIICATNGGKLAWSDNTAMGHPPKWAPGGEMSNRLTSGERRNQWGGSSTNGGSTNARKQNGSRDGKPRPSHHLATADRLRTQGYNAPVLANPGNVLKFVVGGGVMGSDLAHENEAPFCEGLPEFFIRSFCPPDGKVLDPFMGSGTTLAAALKAGRQGIGIDVRQSQVDLTKRRLAEVQRELFV